MRVYTMHYRPASRSPDRDIAVVKEGFCWPAALFTVFWALWHRLWLAAVLIIVAGVGLELVLALSGADGATSAACLVGFHAFIGFEANDWRRAKLLRLGHRDAGIVAAQDAESGIRRFFDLHPEHLPRGDGAGV